MYLDLMQSAIEEEEVAIEEHLKTKYTNIVEMSRGKDIWPEMVPLLADANIWPIAEHLIALQEMSLFGRMAKENACLLTEIHLLSEFYCLHSNGNPSTVLALLEINKDPLQVSNKASY